MTFPTSCHYCELLSPNRYKVGWTATLPNRSEPIEHHRITDLKGAVEFCRKWGIAPPSDAVGIEDQPYVG